MKRDTTFGAGWLLITLGCLLLWAGVACGLWWALS